MNLDKENTLEPSGEFAARIRDFRSAVEHVAAREAAHPVTAGWLAPAQKRRRSAQQRMILGWACAALLCFATLPFSTSSHHAAPPQVAVVIATASAADSDTALLEQVDTDVSESVPSSLAPLVELDSWSAQTTNTERTNATQ